MRKRASRAVFIWTTLLFLTTGLSCERFEPQSMLVVRTHSAEENPGGGYLFTGIIINIGNGSVTQHGFCWSESPDPTIRDGIIQLGARQETGDYTGITRDLDPDTRYYFRAYATSEEGTVYGAEKVLTTRVADLPEVITLTVRDEKENSAIGGGEVVSDGGGNILARGVCWSTLPGPAVEGHHTVDGTGTGSFSSVLEGLYCSTVYYARAYATNESGTAYGAEVEFSTAGCTPAEGEFLYSDNGGSWIINEEGARIWFSSGASPDIEVSAGLIYLHQGNTIDVYTREGSFLRSIAIDPLIDYAYVMCLLPGEEFAFLDNSNDLVSFTDRNGTLKEVVSITGRTADGSLQNVDGVVVGNQLIISEDNERNLIGINLDTYERSVFKSLGEQLTGWLGDIDYSDGLFYMVQSRKVHVFTKDGEAELLCELPEGNNTGIAVHEDFAYVTSNFGNKIYRINIRNGAYSVLVDDLDNPRDIELFP